MQTTSPRASEPGVGIILPGSGARGAYQAGSVLYLAEHFVRTGLRVEAIAGASLGALHGAVLASAPTFLEGAQNLVQLWAAVGQLPPARLKLLRGFPSVELGALLSLLLSAGASTSLPVLMKEIGKTAAHALASGHHLSPALEAAAKIIRFEPEIKVGADLRERLRELLDNQNSSGIPLYVSVYSSRGAILDSVGLVLESLAAIDTSASQLIHIQSLPESTRWEMVLASTAMPFIFDAREISGKEWRGGPLGGWRAQPGQVPASELCERVTVSTLYVLHASDGSLWDRRGASLPPTVETIEIRPSLSIGSGNTLKDSLHADEGTIENRLARGYEDARKQIGEIQYVREQSMISRLARDRLKGDIGELEQDE